MLPLPALFAWSNIHYLIRKSYDVASYGGKGKAAMGISYTVLIIANVGLGAAVGFQMAHTFQWKPHGSVRDQHMLDGSETQRRQHTDLLRIKFYHEEDMYQAHDYYRYLTWPKDSVVVKHLRGPDVAEPKIIAGLTALTGVFVIIFALSENLHLFWVKIVVFLACCICGSQVFFYAIHHMAWTFAEQRARSVRTQELSNGLKSMHMKLKVVDVPVPANANDANAGTDWPKKVLFNLKKEGVEVVHTDTRKCVVLWKWKDIAEWGHTESKKKRENDHLYVKIVDVGEFGFECSHGKSEDVLDAISFFLDENDRHGVSAFSVASSDTQQVTKDLARNVAGLLGAAAGKAGNTVGQTWIGAKVGKAGTAVGGAMGKVADKTGMTVLTNKAADKVAQAEHFAQQKTLQAGHIMADRMTDVTSNALKPPGGGLPPVAVRQIFCVATHPPPPPSPFPRDSVGCTFSSHFVRAPALPLPAAPIRRTRSYFGGVRDIPRRGARDALQ
jgi:hypothetical protein